MRQYVPHAVISKDGNVLDADSVMKEVVKDGDDVFVEYGSGPCAFTTQWEGRPSTPDFKWGDDGVVLPAHDLWLEQLDLIHENVDALVDKDVTSVSPETLPKDLAAVKALLKEHAGSLQACFLHFECQGAKEPKTIGRMNLTQFKAFCAAAKAPVGKFTGDKLDDIFTAVAASPSALERKLDSTASSTMSFVDFLISLVHVAYHRFASMKPDMASHTYLADKVDALLSECTARNVYPTLAAAVEKYAFAQSKGAQAMLRKGRRLTEQTLDACQMKRTKAADVEVELKHVACHMEQWLVVGNDVGFPDLAAIALFAKHRSHDVGTYELLQQPLVINYDEFEGILLGVAFHMFDGNKSNAAPFEEFLGSVMDRIFRTCGVLVDHVQE